MKSFKDIKFKPHRNYGLHGLIFFDNGYGVSVVRYKSEIGLPDFLSYTSNEDEWELAVIKGKEDDWDLCYDTHITDDVIGHLSEGEVNWIMIQVQELPA